VARRSGGCTGGAIEPGETWRIAANGPPIWRSAPAARCADETGSFDDEGSWEDDNAVCRPWGFDLADIQAPVCIWHGMQDFLPVAHARWLADRIPNVTTHFPPDEDHTNIEETTGPRHLHG